MNNHFFSLPFFFPCKVVMKSQQHLVDVIGKFTPKIVKMDGAKHKTWGKRKDDTVGE
jgi:tRNA-splicing ligase RtcB